LIRSPGWSKGKLKVTEAWYAIYSKFQHEKSAAALLARKQFEVFLPVYRAVHRWKDRNQIVILPLFPCYFFVRSRIERKTEILQTAGVRWIVESAGRVCPLPEPEIEAIRRVCALAKAQPHPFLEEGQRVRVRTGPLAGTEGFYVRAKNQYRMIVSIQLLQQAVSVEMDISDLQFIKEEPGFTSGPCDISRLTA
jgi:transcription antitermination factor NusG